MKNLLRILGLGLITFALVMSVSIQTAGAAGKEPYYIGSILSLTGPASTFGLPERDGLMYGVDSINKKGGINGHPLEVIIEDDQTNPTSAVKAANKLIARGNISAIVGATVGSITMAFAPVAARAGIPVMAINSTLKVTEKNSGYYDWVFRASVSDRYIGPALFEYVTKKMVKKRIGLIYQSDGYGLFGKEIMERLCKETPGVELVRTEQFEMGSTNVTPQLTNVKAAKPDVLVMWVSAGNTAGVALRNKQEIGLHVPVIAPFGAAQPTTIKVAGKAAEGLIVCGYIDSDKPLPNQKKFVEGFTKKYNRKPGNVFDMPTGVLIPAHAISKVGPNPKAVRDAMENPETWKDFQGPEAGPVMFTRDDHDGLTDKSIMWQVVKNGKFGNVE